MSSARALLAIVTMFVCVGCPTTIQVDGQTVVEDDYKRHRAGVLRVAEAELGCPRDQLTTKVLERSVHATVDRFQVAGCGKSAVFKYQFDAADEFVLDK
jgi:hypothetical protein